jgi:hypothetical protein
MSSSGMAWAMKTWMVSSKSEEVSESESAATIFTELVVLLDEALEDEPRDEDFADEDLPDVDLPEVLLDELFDAKFDPDDFSSCSCLWHLEAVCPLFL